MYKIIGADGKEYGPITVDQLKRWIAESRVNGQTKVLPEGATEWKLLADIPELAAALPIAPLIGPAASLGAAPATDLVNGPAIGLIATAGLGFLATLIGLVWNIVGANLANFQQPGMPPEMERMMQIIRGPVAVFSAILGLVLAGLILVGALKMKKCQSYGWAMTASILALYPCSCPTCLLGIPIGIWALVVLSKPEVKSAFH